MTSVNEEALNILCGAELGEGIHRKVYACKLRPDLVVKVEQVPESGYRSFANVMEYKFWYDNQDYKPVAQWLAPIDYVSPDGLIILQKRCAPASSLDKARLPKQVPSFLCDIKASNFGFLNGKLVCFDYALTTLGPSIRLRKVHW